MKLACSKCRQHFEVEADQAGKAVQCPACGTVLAVPSLGGVPTLRSSAISPPPARREGIPGFVEFLFYVITLAMGAFGYVTYKNHELPQQTWQRLVSLLRGSPELPPPPTFVQQPTPIQESSNPAPESTTAPVVTPAPPSDPFAWLIAHRNRWPKEVTLLETQNFPAVSNGKVVGSVAVPANATVTLAEIIQPDVVIIVASGGGEKKLPFKVTNLLELAKREMQRPEPTPTP